MEPRYEPKTEVEQEGPQAGHSVPEHPESRILDAQAFREDQTGSKRKGSTKNERIHMNDKRPQRKLTEEQIRAIQAGRRSKKIRRLYLEAVRHSTEAFGEAIERLKPKPDAGG